MDIKNIRHKGLRRLYAKGDAKALPPDAVSKLVNMLGFLDAMADPKELSALSAWKAHQLKGDRAGTWSLHVTKNWRLTFWIDSNERLICDLDFEDYH